MRPKPRRLVLATRNRDKIREIRNALSSLPITLLTVDDFLGAPEVVEDGQTLAENASKKATALHEFTGLPALADDTGLYVDALDGAPGVHSSRYAGEQASYADNVRKLLAAMKGIPSGERQARFRTVIALADDHGVHLIEGICEGYIATAPAGEGGFGYDPVFVVAGSHRTFAEMTLEEKNAVSHRGRALSALRMFLKEQYAPFQLRNST